MKLFENRKLVIATKHQKEKVIALLFEKELGVKCFTIPDFDTDVLGTFSGEVARNFDPIETARQKCLLAMEMSNCDLGVASEGSFGAHPTFFFAAADDEMIIFIDKKNNLEIIAREISTETNFSGKEIKSQEELLDFAHSVQFPSHGLILRNKEGDINSIIKDISSIDELLKAFNKLTQATQAIYAETDMRAMNNPTRMKVIEIAARKLVDKIKSECPQCNTAGFALTAAVAGLKCSLCGAPTKSTLSYQYVCQHCQYTKQEIYPHKKEFEDPMYCDYCNP